MSCRLHTVLDHLPSTTATMFHNLGVIFIIGGGPKGDEGVANAFAQKGYKVAVASPSIDKNEIRERGWLPVEVDLTDHKAIHKGFETVRSKIGEPNVVVYNAGHLTRVGNATEDPFSITGEQYQHALQINVAAAYTCLHETVQSFKALEDTNQPTRGLPRVFIAGGNVAVHHPIPFAWTLASGKAALMHLVQIGNMTYRMRGWRFYFATQGIRDGKPVAREDIDREAPGRKYVELVQQKALGEWDVRFV